MKKNLIVKLRQALAVIAAVTGTCVGALPGCSGAAPPHDNPPDVVIQQDRLADLQAELSKRIESTTAGAMKSSGLAGAMGGAHIKVTSANPQEVLLPLPQLTGGQVPVCYFISSMPGDAVTEFKLRKLEDDNDAVIVRLAGKKQDVQVTWSAVVLLSPWDITPDRTPPEPYRSTPPCVQSERNEVKQLAAEIWPQSGRAAGFAANIQRHIGAMKRAERPKSLDAVGILKSGENSICTANSNLAAALMRSKEIACRSVAVIPPISQRLEMHRIAEFSDNGQWVPFDPSSLQIDIPTKPWQNITMAKTSVPDEQAAMKLRMGAMLGCPYGQEAELLTSGVTLFGQDFFWTIAKPLAEFELTEESARAAAAAWVRYLKSGTLTRDQLEGSAAQTAAEFAESMHRL